MSNINNQLDNILSHEKFNGFTDQAESLQNYAEALEVIITTVEKNNPYPHDIIAMRSYLYEYQENIDNAFENEEQMNIILMEKIMILVANLRNQNV